MAIVNTIDNATQFVSQFQAIRPDNFTQAGLKTLFYHLDEMSEATGENIEFDPVAICCEYSEYTIDELRNSFGGCSEVYDEEYMESDNTDDAEQAVLDHAVSCGAYLTDNDTIVIHCADEDSL